MKKEKEICWCSVTVASKKRGGGLTAIVDNDTVRATQRPSDEHFETSAREFKRRYFKTLTEAERVRDVLNRTEITINRVRYSVTQGECEVFINRTYILNFGDKIEMIPQGQESYGECYGDWASVTPDSSMVLGLIWHPYESLYHYDKLICEKLGIEPGEWIGGQE